MTERESRPAGNEAASTTAADDSQYKGQSDTKPGKSLVWLPCTRPPVAQDTRSRLRRRSDAAKRSVPLDCGHHRDPMRCDCTKPRLSEHALDGWRDAALRILFDGCVPLLPIEVRRALWKRGGPDRVLAERLHEACGGEVA